MAAIFLFVFKMGSRNQMNLSANDDELIRNVEKIFGFKIAHMDTVNNFFADLDPKEMEGILAELVRVLIKNKVLSGNKSVNGSHLIAIDGTGDGPATKEDDGTLKKVSKNGKETFYRSMLVASLITTNGFSIPIAVEWIATEDGAEKQDCELNAFKRLAAKIKEYFPRLRICLVGDALYANASLFSICKDNNWNFVTTVKDNLSTVNNFSECHAESFEYTARIDGKLVKRIVSVMRGVKYQDFEISWMKTVEKDANGKELTFKYVTNLPLPKDQIPDIISAFRARWNIEDTFNTMKNRGCKSLHKYAQKSLNAYKNWRITLLISQVVEQLVVMANDMAKIFDRANDTFQNLWHSLVTWLSYVVVEPFVEKPRRKISYPR